MIGTHYFRKIVLLLGDILILFVAFFLALLIREAGLPSAEFIGLHIYPMGTLFLIWLLTFYIAGIYDIEKFISFGQLRNAILKTMLSVGIISVIVFYTVPFWGITPKTILVIDLFVATVLLWSWRRFFFVNIVKSSKTNVIFFGSSPDMKDFADTLNNRPQLSYYVSIIIPEGEDHDIEDYIKKHNIDIIVASDEIKQNDNLVNMFYKVLPMGVTIIDFSKFYESLTGRVPVSIINRSWFLENLVEINKRTYESIKRIMDIILAILFGFVTLIFLLPVAVITKLTSPGPIFYWQNRVGKNGKVFEVVKFRTMVSDAEKNGAEWSGKEDSRITPFGKFLRKTRIDELPQVWNIFKGDLSFVGPRPERPEFARELMEKIPHYKMKYLIKPGLTGWAQINLPYGASMEYTTKKLQYELCYIKNRSFGMDLAIILKTIRTVLSHEGR